VWGGGGEAKKQSRLYDPGRGREEGRVLHENVAPRAERGTWVENSFGLREREKRRKKSKAACASGHDREGSAPADRRLLLTKKKKEEGRKSNHGKTKLGMAVVFGGKGREGRARVSDRLAVKGKEEKKRKAGGNKKKDGHWNRRKRKKKILLLERRRCLAKKKKKKKPKGRPLPACHRTGGRFRREKKGGSFSALSEDPPEGDMSTTHTGERKKGKGRRV